MASEAYKGMKYVRHSLNDEVSAFLLVSTIGIAFCNVCKNVVASENKNISNLSLLYIGNIVV